METSYNEIFQTGNNQVMSVDLQSKTPENLANLQMVLVTSSMNHEYARQEYDQAKSYQRKQELLGRMSDLKQLYFQVRQSLSLTHPEKLEELEVDLLFQKQAVLNEYPI